MTPLITTVNAATMTSIELVDFINSERKKDAERAGVAFPSKGFAKLEHGDFLKKVPEVLGEHAGIFSCMFDVLIGNGATRKSPGYVFPKREACLMAMSYSYDLQAKVFDKMTALEAQQSTPPAALPNYAEALRQLADQAEQIEAQQAQLALAAPKVAFVERYVEATGLKGFREVCKLLKANEARFREFVTEKKILYKLGGAWTAYQPHLDAGRFEVRTGVADSEHAFSTTKFTAKGVDWIAGEWAKHQLREGGAA